MKVRVGFVANSSSSSFVASEDGEVVSVNGDLFVSGEITIGDEFATDREEVIWFPVSPEDRLEAIYENSNDNSRNE